MNTNIPATPPQADPTLKVGAHVGAVVAGAVAGYASTKMGLTLDPTAEAYIAMGVASLTVTVVHYLQALYVKLQADV